MKFLSLPGIQYVLPDAENIARDQETGGRTIKSFWMRITENADLLHAKINLQLLQYFSFKFSKYGKLIKNISPTSLKILKVSKLVVTLENNTSVKQN